MDDIKIEYLSGNGGYDTPECIEFLKECDVVVTNPPFSLFRDYVKCLMDYGKKFIIIGNKNAITYKEIFPLIKNNELWLGFNYVKEFIDDENEIKKFGNINWFTNVEHSKRNIPIDLYKKYNPEEFPNYDNYNAIEVSKVCEIPMDYEGVMGVPITFLDKYCPNQFEIIGATESEGKGFSQGLWIESAKVAQPKVNNNRIYKRIFIKRLS